ncbi:MAG: SDR family oxidoreductase [Chloroflexota bacterium]|jgi:putative NADH-flavin reductase
MNIAVFGGTGKTGQYFIRKALEAGLQVVALARTPEKLTTRHERLKVIAGDAGDPACVAQVVSGTDVVVSLLGPAKGQPAFAISRATQNILDAMKSGGVQRLVISAGAGVGDPEDQPKLINRLINVILRLSARDAYEDMMKAAALVRQSGLDWTIVRVPMLTDDPATGQVKVGMVGKGTGARISRADMADFILQQAQQRNFAGKAPMISN